MGARRRQYTICPVLVLLVLLSFMFGSLALSQEMYKVAVLPEYLPIELWQRFHPILMYLEDVIRARFELVIASSFEGHISLVKEGRVQFFYHNPYVFVQVWDYCSPLTITKQNKGAIESKGVIIARKDSHIEGITSLRGKRISVASTYSAGGFIAPKLLLEQNGLSDADVFIVEAKGNQQENVLHDVLDRRAEAGFVNEAVLKRIESKGSLSPGRMQDLSILAYTEAVPNWVFCANKTLPMNIQEKVQKTLLNIPPDHPVLTDAQIEGFARVPVGFLDRYRAKTGRQ